MGSLEYPLGVVRFIHSRCVHSRKLLCSARLGVVGFIASRWVHSRVPLGSLGVSGVVRFARARPLRRLIHPVSLTFALVVFGII